MNSTSLFSLVGSPQPLVPPRQKEEEYKVSTLRKVFCFVFINDFCLIFFYYTCIDLFGEVCILYHEYRSQKGTCRSQFVINQAGQQASALHAEPYCSLRKSHGAQVAGQLLILLPQHPGCHLVHERGFLGVGETETSLKLPLLSGMPLGTRVVFVPELSCECSCPLES